MPKLYDGRNKTFFLADYEGLRNYTTSTALDSVLTPLMRMGDFSEIDGVLTDPLHGGSPLPGNSIPASEISPIATKLLAYMPAANLAGTTANIQANYPTNDTFNQMIFRIDHNIAESARVFFRYARQTDDILAGATNPTSNLTVPVTTRNWVAAYTQTFTPTLINDLRVGQQKLDTNALNYWYVNNLSHAGTDLGIPGFDGDTRFSNPGIPDMNIDGFMGLGNGGTNWFQNDTTWQGTDALTWVHGRHTLIAGAELRKLITGRSAVNSARGVFDFDGSMTGYGAADFMIGLPIDDTTPGPEIYNKVAEWRDGFYVVDNWQVSKRLSLNLGLRYELPTVPYTVNGYALILNPTWTAMLPANPPQPGMKLTGPDHNNWAPRFGLAYRLTPRTVIRAGFGVYYNPNQTNTFTFLSNNPPFSVVTTYNASAGDPTLSFVSPTPASALGSAPKPNVISPNPYLPSASMNQWSFNVEQGLWHNAALEVQYLGSHSLHLDRSYFPNTPLPGPGSISARRPNQIFARIRIIQNDEIANYEGGSLIMRQRLSHGITALASYTWSHALDITSDSNDGGSPMNPYNWAADYGNSNWDVRNRFVGSFTYDMPFFKQAANPFLKQALGGWQANGVITVQTGFPFNVTIGSDVANTGLGSQRPDLIGTPSASCGGGNLINCISATAFTQPAAYTYGNAGRNLLYGPGLANVDFSLFKNFGIFERLRTQFRAEFFNFLNHPAFGNPSSTIQFNNAASFGNITSTVHDNREIQFGLKLLF